MKTVVVSGTSWESSRLAFGTGSLHHLASTRARIRLLDSAADLGFCHFDTSPYYGHGIAEIDLGRMRSIRSGNVTVASKIALYPPPFARPRIVDLYLRRALGPAARSVSLPVKDFSTDRASKSLDLTLRRLGRSWVDTLLIHEPMATHTQLCDLFDLLTRERDAGRIRSWGLAGTVESIENAVSPASENAPLVIQSSSEALTNPALHDRLSFVFGALRGRVSDRDSIKSALAEVWAVNRNVGVVISSRNLAHLRDIAAAEAEIA